MAEESTERKPILMSFVDKPRRLRVVGTGSYLPEKVVTNEDFEGRKVYKYDGDKRIGEGEGVSADWIVKTTGMKRRHYCASGEFPSDMAAKASINVLESYSKLKNIPIAGVFNGLAGILTGCVSEDKNFPQVANTLLEKLGAKFETAPRIFSLNIEYACAASPLLLGMASSFNSNGMDGLWLVSATEDVSRMWEPDDRDIVLFGAGAGAVLLEPTEEQKGVLACYGISDPHNGKSGWITRHNRKGKMPQGPRVLRNATREMLDAAKILKEHLGWSKADVYIPHQANERIIADVESRIREEGSVVHRTLEEHANMSSATCFYALDDALRKGIIKEGMKVILTSFGAGLTTSAAAIQF